VNARSGWSAASQHCADEGVNRAVVAGGAMMEKRYLLRANPAGQWNGAAGNNANEAVWRDTAGGNCGGPRRRHPGLSERLAAHAAHRPDLHRLLQLGRAELGGLRRPHVHRRRADAGQVPAF
jgi:hypothetical protein